MMNFDTVELENGITKVVLSGRMDIEGASAVDLKFSVLAGAKKRIAVDLTDVSFMASMGIRTLMLSAKAAVNKGGKMVLVNPQPSVEKVLRTTGVDTIMPIVPTIDEASRILAA
ncbi:MAG: STAS domain-containing protein [Rhodomicrobium sp.]